MPEKNLEVSRKAAKPAKKNRPRKARKKRNKNKYNFPQSRKEERSGFCTGGLKL
jgi:hypothetical protein